MGISFASGRADLPDWLTISMALLPIRLDIALLFQGLQVIEDPSGRSYFEPLTDLRDGRGITFFTDGGGEKFVDALLPRGQLGKHA